MRFIIAALALCGLVSGAYGQAPSVEFGNGEAFSTPGGGRVQTVAPVQISPSGVAGGAALGNAGYPPGATPIGASTTATTGGIALSLPSTANQFSYLCSLSVSPGSAGTAITIQIQTANSVGGGTWFVGAPATAVGVTGAIFTVSFSPCIRSNTTNQGVSLTVGALGTGGVNQAATMTGYSQ